MREETIDRKVNDFLNMLIGNEKTAKLKKKLEEDVDLQITEQDKRNILSQEGTIYGMITRADIAVKVKKYSCCQVKRRGNSNY